MPTRKVKDIDGWDAKICRDPDHNPPTMMVYQPGVYEHECPSCHRTFTFVVRSNHLADMSGKIWKSTEKIINKYRVRWGV